MDGWVDACMDLWVDEWMKEGDYLGSFNLSSPKFMWCWNGMRCF